MSEYILILIWLGVILMISHMTKVTQLETVEGERVRRYNWLFAFIVFLPIIWMAGTRELWYADTTAYWQSFLRLPDTWKEFSADFSTEEKDWGFTIFSYIVKSCITKDPGMYFTIIAAIQGICILSVFRKYSSKYICSVFLFIASTDYLSWMYNGIRQFLAVTLIFACTPLMLKKKYVPLIAVILLASTIHKSALLMIPFVFIAQGKAWNWRTLVAIALTVLAVLFVGEFTTWMDDSLQNTQYKNVVSDYTSLNDDGTNPLRVAVYSVPTLFAILCRKRLAVVRNPLLNLCTNMSILSTAIYVISIFTSGVYIGRIPIYASLYGYILLPWEIDHAFSKKTRPLVYIGMVCLYLTFYYISLWA